MTETTRGLAEVHEITPHPPGYCLIGDTLVWKRLPSYGTSPELDEIREWLAFHGIDPGDIPLPAVVHRDLGGRCVFYTRAVRDATGKLIVDWSDGRAKVQTVRERAQGETPPLPWPEALQPCPLPDEHMPYEV